jgi:hypothetical protein|tara:strand:- start:200 stop:712 length:513 start_codon:yes stop_codon:yes gene_type:complete
MITKIDTQIPEQTNRRILAILLDVSGWGFGKDVRSVKNNVNKKDSGFLLSTYEYEKDNDHVLNVYAEIIFDFIQKNSYLKFKHIYRIYWNWYHPGSEMTFHDDEKKDNYYSIVYNLHNNDGGTEFKINDKIEFYPSVVSQAIVFPSKLIHRGIAPNKFFNRFSLNMVVEI